MWGRKVKKGAQEEECMSRRVCAGSALLRTQSQGAKHSKAWLTSLEKKAPGLGGQSRTESLDLLANTGMQGLKHELEK